MTASKIASIVGFAVRAGKTAYGLDGIERAGARVRVIIRCRSLSEGSAGKLRAFAAGRGIPVLVSRRPLSEIVHRDNCKAIGITDAQMAAAVLRYTDENFQREPAEVQ